MKDETSRLKSDINVIHLNIILDFIRRAINDYNPNPKIICSVTSRFLFTASSGNQPRSNSNVGSHSTRTSA